ERDMALASAKAWALFDVGRLEEAKDINDRLLSQRRDQADLALDVNLALQFGDWERLPVIVEREWPGRDTHSPETLLHLASIAAYSPSSAGRAFDLASLAALKAPDDPDVLIAAYAFSVQLGRERDANPQWLMRAAKLSTSE